MARGGHELCEVLLGPSMTDPSMLCGQATPQAVSGVARGRVVCGCFLTLWTPHAVRLCDGRRGPPGVGREGGGGREAGWGEGLRRESCGFYRMNENEMKHTAELPQRRSPSDGVRCICLPSCRLCTVDVCLSFICSFVHSFIHSFIYSFIHLFIPPSVCDSRDSLPSAELTSSAILSARFMTPGSFVKGYLRTPLKFHPGPPCLIFLRPASKPPPKLPHGHFSGGPPAGQTTCRRLQPPWSKLHDKRGAKWIVITGQFRGHNDMPFGRPTPGRLVGRPGLAALQAYLVFFKYY
jgi:hypothetical protein